MGGMNHTLTIDYFNRIVQESYETAKDKGWWEDSRGIPALLLLMQSEIAEALEDYRSNKGLNEVYYEEKTKADGSVERKPCGIPIEIADAIIRVADFFGHYNLTLDPTKIKRSFPTEFEEGLCEANLAFSKAYEIHRNFAAAIDIEYYLNKAVAALFSLCKAHDIDIVSAIDEKLAFNKTRPHRHGGKKI